MTITTISRRLFGAVLDSQQSRADGTEFNLCLALTHPNLSHVELFITPKRIYVPTKQCLPSSIPSHPLVTCFVLSASTHLPNLNTSCKWKHNICHLYFFFSYVFKVHLYCRIRQNFTHMRSLQRVHGNCILWSNYSWISNFSAQKWTYLLILFSMNFWSTPVEELVIVKAQHLCQIHWESQETRLEAIRTQRWSSKFP